MAAKIEYRGGIPELKKTGLTQADAFPDCLVVMNIGFSFKQFKLPYAQMLNVELVPEGAKKKNYVLNVEYITAGGFNSIVVLTGKEVSKLYGELQKARDTWLRRNPGAVKAAAAEAPAAGPSVDVATEIQKFFDLKEKGVISEDEFNTKKAQLLGV